jgi:nitrite reductase/ring-hydroxylating ferredoxin subunit
VSERRVIASFRREDLPDRKPVPLVHPPGHLVVVRVGERVFALDHACSHAGASLLNAEVHERTITCRAHGCVFDLESGALLSRTDEAPFRQGTWPVERRGDVWVVLG